MTDKENRQFIFGCVFLLANKLQLLGDKLTGELTLKQWFLLKLIQQMDNKTRVTKTLLPQRQEREFTGRSDGI